MRRRVSVMHKEDIAKRDAAWLKAAQASDEEAWEKILEAYKPLVLNRASHYFLKLSSRDDLVQEGMIALFKAVLKCPEERFSDFSAYAFNAVDNRLKDLLKHEQTGKAQVEIQALSLEADKRSNSTSDKLRQGDTIKANVATPEDFVLADESMAQLLKALDDCLSKQEEEVLRAAMQGQSYEEIAQEFALSVKAVDSTLQRARRKLRQFREENN